MKKIKKTVVEQPPVKVNTFHTNKVARANPVNVSPDLGAGEVNNLTKCTMTVSNPQNILNTKPRDIQPVQQAVNGKVADHLVGKTNFEIVPDTTPPMDFIQIKKPKKTKAT